MRTLEVREVPARHPHSIRLVGDRDVHHAVRHLDGERTDLLGPLHSEPAALDHRRATHADRRLGRRDHHIAATEQRRIARETAPGRDPDQRHQTTEPSHLVKRHEIQPCDSCGVRIAGPPAAALREEHHGEPPPLGELQHPVGLAVVLVPLSAGEHRVVVRHRHARSSLDRPGAGDHAVGGRGDDQVLQRAAAALGGDGERPELGEAARVAECVDVLPGRAAADPMPFGDRVGTVLVQADRMAAQRLGEIRAYEVEVDAHIEGPVIGRFVPRRVEQHHRLSLCHRVAHRRRYGPYGPGRGRPEDMLHLHRLEDEQLLPGPHCVSRCDIDRHDGAAHRCLGGTRIGVHRAREVRELFEEAGVRAARGELRVRKYRPEQRNPGSDALDPELAERPGGPLARRRETGAGRHPGDHLREERVVPGARRQPRTRRRVHPYAGACRYLEPAHSPGFLGVHPGLHGKTAGWRRLGETERLQRLALSQTQLYGDQIHARHLLGDGVFHLEPRIGLDEMELLTGDEEFESREPGHARLARHPQRGAQQPVPQLRGQRGRRSDLDQLLVAALGAAVPLPQMGHRPGGVAEDLHLDMTGTLQQPLDVQLAPPEGLQSLRPAAFPGFRKIAEGMHGPHTAPAASAHGLHHHRPAGTQPREELPRLLRTRRPVRPREHRHTDPLGEDPRPPLVAEERQHLGRRPHKADSRLRAARGETGVLAEEAVSGVQQAAPGPPRRRQHRPAVQIRGRSRPRQRHRLVGQLDML